MKFLITLTVLCACEWEMSLCLSLLSASSARCCRSAFADMRLICVFGCCRAFSFIRPILVTAAAINYHTAMCDETGIIRAKMECVNVIFYHHRFIHQNNTHTHAKLEQHNTHFCVCKYSVGRRRTLSLSRSQMKNHHLAWNESSEMNELKDQSVFNQIESHAMECVFVNTASEYKVRA